MPELEPKIGVINTFKTQKTEVQFALGEFVDNSIDSYFKYKDDLEKENKDFKPYIDINIRTGICIKVIIYHFVGKFFTFF